MTADPTVYKAASRRALWVPPVLFLGFALIVALAVLQPQSAAQHQSAAISVPLPALALPAAVDERPGLARADLRDGRPRLINLFASWCLPCQAEAPQLEQLRRAGVEIHGIAVRDRRTDLTTFLRRNGNPYARIGSDPAGVAQRALAAGGVPDSFVVDGRGVILYHHGGDITAAQVPLILSKLREAAR